MIQEVLATATVTLAAVYLVYKLVLQPALRDRAPDVPARRLRRRR